MSDAKSQKTKKPINQNLTVPNAMSVFRILVIPFFAYFFLKGNLTAAIVALGLSGLYDALDGKFVISIVAGWTYEMLKDALPDAARFVRVMPNTPLAVGEGMSLISSLCTCTDEEFDFAKSVFAAAGKVAVVDDHVYTPANGISGCGPAFVYAFIEAMADGGVRYGVPRALAYELAAQTLVGAAKMVLETGEHPGRLKDAVCSPGGTTIEGMYALEKGGMRAAVMDAVGATVEKTMRMAKK